jgi:hypothetical protein
MRARANSIWGTIALFAAVAVAFAVIALAVGMVTVVLPATGALCSSTEPGTPGMEAANVPAGLSKLAAALWDKPLHMIPGKWYPAGATEYYAGDSTGSGHHGSIPVPTESNLDEHPDSFAELSMLPSNPANTGAGFTFADANALGNLPYMSALRVAHAGRSIVVYKRDIGYGQGPLEHTPEGFEYRVDLWGPAANAIGVTKSPVDIQLLPTSGAAQTLGQTEDAQLAAGEPEAASGEQCLGGGVQGPLPLTPGQQAKILPDGLAAAPAEAPAAVKAMIAAGNRLHGLPYIWGGGHGVSLNTLQPGYDCSGAVSYVLHAGGALGESALDSTGFESYGKPGPGKWVSIYADAGHVFMYVAGLRFDTVYAPEWDRGPNSGKPGPRWRVYPGVPTWATDWIVRHPPGL